MRNGPPLPPPCNIMMMSSQETPAIPVVREAVVSWTRDLSPHLRAPVLPDLRSGGGFTLVIWLSLAQLGEETCLPLPLVDGMSRVSGSLGDILTKLTVSLIFSQMRRTLMIL